MHRPTRIAAGRIHRDQQLESDRLELGQRHQLHHAADAVPVDRHELREVRWRRSASEVQGGVPHSWL